MCVGGVLERSLQKEELDACMFLSIKKTHLPLEFLLLKYQMAQVLT